MISGKKCAERWRREVLEKYRAEEVKKSACRGHCHERENTNKTWQMADKGGWENEAAAKAATRQRMAATT